MIVPIIRVGLCSSFLTHLTTACQGFMQDEMFTSPNILWSTHAC